MKTLANMKNFLLLAIMLIAFNSCDTDDINETPTPEAETEVDDITRILGEWEMFKREKQDLTLDFDAGELIQSVQWIDVTSSIATESILEFNEDYSFGDFYADVLVSDGIWNKVDDYTYSFTFNDPLRNWSEYTDTYAVNFYCDNTMSIQFLTPPPAGEHDFQDADWYIIQYYRSPGTRECADLIEYLVD
ncbi:hypothetical protein OAD62_02035 [Oceanihabitans sp.]|nr:hypothetical protein [Oceanihabitans sp.]